MLEAVRDKRGVPDGEALIATIKHFRANPDEQLSMPSSVHLKAVTPALEEQEESDDILDIFLEEADELLEELESAAGRLESSAQDSAPVADILRVLHTLKGGARLAGQRRLGDLCHDLEQHVSEAQQRGAPWPESLLADVQSGFEGLQSELELLRQRLHDSSIADVQPTLSPAPTSEPQNSQDVPLSTSLAALDSPFLTASALPAKVEIARVLPFVRRAQEAAQEAASRRAPQEQVKA